MFFLLLLQRVFAKVIREKLDLEIRKAQRESSTAHWIQNVFPSRVIMSLFCPMDDLLLNTKNSQGRLSLMRELESIYRIDIVFHFEILQRTLVLKLVRGVREGEEDQIEMIFYEHSAQRPDLKIQEVLRRELESAIKEKQAEEAKKHDVISYYRRKMTEPRF